MRAVYYAMLAALIRQHECFDAGTFAGAPLASSVHRVDLTTVTRWWFPELFSGGDRGPIYYGAAGISTKLPDQRGIGTGRGEGKTNAKLSRSHGRRP
jgi:hypothetical protein